MLLFLFCCQSLVLFGRSLGGRRPDFANRKSIGQGWTNLSVVMSARAVHVAARYPVCGTTPASGLFDVAVQNAKNPELP
ncbi:MAG TPA: hypothetical protein PLQ64_09695 [Thiobacillaceae bacterium]|nr:hypothetical protein [Thiobacillaceae bacterium]